MKYEDKRDIICYIHTGHKYYTTITSKKHLSTIAFVWGQFFADSKKESFEKIVFNKDQAARLLEFNLDGMRPKIINNPLFLILKF